MSMRRRPWRPARPASCQHSLTREAPRPILSGPIMTMLRVAANISISDSQINQVAGDQYNDCTFITKEPDERRTIAEWLSPLNFEPYQAKVFLERVDGTGQWMLESKTFQSWRDGPSGTLFCPGMPGSGKTVMSSFVIDHLRRFFHDVPDVAIAFIYLDYKKQNEQTLLNLMSNLLKQLIQPPFVSLDDVRSLYQTHWRWSSRPTPNDIRTGINKEIAKFGKVFIIVDALDELSEESGVRAELLKAIRSLRGPVNLMVTSREIPSIMLAFQDTIRLDIYARDGDVRRYVHDWIPDWYPADLQDLVIQQITQRASGMFLLARLHMDALLACTSVVEVREAIRGLPQDITATYGNAIERIKQQRERNRKLAFAVLSWVTFAGRPLTVTELQFAVAVKPGMTTLTSEHAIHETLLTSYCAGLIVIDEKTRLIRLVHYSTQEYFETNRDELFPEAQVDLTRTCLAYLLFDDLQNDISIDAQTLFRFWHEHPLLDYAARYWGRHVRGPAELAEKTLLHMILQSPGRRDYLSRIALLDLHIGNPPINISAVRTSLQLPSHLFRQTGFTALHLCAFFGLRQTIEYELANGAQADQRDDEGRTPLTWAAHNGHDDVVSFFLSRSDVDVQSRDNYGRTPLCWAARNGHDSVVELVMRCSAVNVNNQDCLGRTPLYSAAQNGNKAIAALLLGLGVVDVNLRDHDGRSPLLRAAELGHHDVVVSLLTRADIDVNAKDEDNHTPLLLAAECGHHEVVRVLLAHEGNLLHSDHTISHEVNINCTDNDHRTPLHWAAKNGCDTVVDLLLAHGAVQANPHDALGLTPFWLAVENGHKTTAQRLLDNPLVKTSVFNSLYHTRSSSLMSTTDWLKMEDITAPPLDLMNPGLETTTHPPAPTRLSIGHTATDARDGQLLAVAEHYLETPLHRAAENGETRVVDILLTLGILPVNSYDAHGSTPLSLAARNGHKTTLQRLLAQPSVDVNHSSHGGRTPLHLAVDSGHDGIVELLLAHVNIHANARDDHHATPLLFAAGKGRKTIINRLLAHPSVVVNLPNDLGRTPLHLAAEDGNDGIVELLLGHANIHVNARDVHNATPLLFAAGKGHNKTASRLLAHPLVDVNLSNHLDQTPLHLAANNGHDGIVELLLAHANIHANARDKHNATPLLFAAENGHGTTVKQLLAHPSVAVNLPNDLGQTPLHLAADNGHDEIVEPLLAHANIRVNAHDRYKVTPLQLAAEKGHDTTVKQFLAHPSVDVNLPNHLGRTPLHLAAGNGHDWVVETLLIPADMNVNARDNHGATPLLLSAGKGYDRTVKQLLTHPWVDINLPDDLGRMPLHLAAEGGYDRMARLLLAHANIHVNACAMSNATPLHLAAGNGHHATVVELLANPLVDVNLPNRPGQTPLHLAADNGHDGTVKILLAHANINVNARDRYNATPLLLAAAKGHDITVRHLLAHPSVDVNLANHPNHGGRTPLHLAAGYGHDGIVELLLAHANIQVNARDTYNVTPLLLAAWAAGIGHNTTTVKQLPTLPVIEANSPDGQGRTAFHLAAENSRSVMHSPNFRINRPDWRNSMALSMAADRMRSAPPTMRHPDPFRTSHLLSNPGIRPLGTAKHYLEVIDRLRARGATFS